MKLLAFASLIFISICLSGQTETPPHLKRFSIGVNLSPDYCYRTTDKQTWYNEDDLPKLGVTIGANFNYFITKKYALEIGINYANRGDQDSWHYDNSSLSAGYKKYIYSAEYIDIPIKMNLLYGKKNIRFISSFGIVANLLMKSSSRLYCTPSNVYPNGTDFTGVTEIFASKKSDRSLFKNTYSKTLTFSAVISAGIDVKLNNRWSMQLKPTAMHAISSAFKNNGDNGDAMAKEYRWSVGLNMGLNYRF